MASAQGECPNCGAPIEFSLGSSLARVCGSCRATVLRTDRGLEDCGRVAALADTPSPISVGDRGSLAGRSFEVVGRIQYDYGLGPWDEYYVAFENGREWGWLAYAQGRWYATQLVPNLVPPARSLARVDSDHSLPIGDFCVAESRTATVVSAEGELPAPVRTGSVSYYADAYGRNGAFATFDYGDGAESPAVFAGRIVADADLSITALGPRALKQVKTSHLQCPNCGGDVPKLHADRSERLGCPYCGAFSDIPARTVLAQQERLMQSPDLPIGTSGKIEGANYTCLAFLRRSTSGDGERYRWDEFLLFAPTVGYRWLVKDPETGWLWAEFVNPADIDRTQAPRQLRYANRLYRLSNTGRARVDYVLGEVYWKCSLGETVAVSDYEAGNQILSREADDEEVNYSHSKPLSWGTIAAAFGLAVAGPGAKGVSKVTKPGQTGCVTTLVLLVLVIVIILIISSAVNAIGGSSVAPIFVGGGSGYRGSGSYSGGK